MRRKQADDRAATKAGGRKAAPAVARTNGRQDTAAVVSSPSGSDREEDERQDAARDAREEAELLRRFRADRAAGLRAASMMLDESPEDELEPSSGGR
jgi:hypothetical protein